MADSDFITPPSGGPDPEHIRSVFVRYGELMAAGDLDGIVALYAPDGRLEDPVGSEPHVGHEAIAGFYKSGFDAMKGPIAMTLEGNVRVSGRNAAAAYIARPLNYPDPVEIETLDVMEFGDDGLIRSMTAYWGPTNFRKPE